MIARMRSTFPIPALCRVLRVSRSGYYAWSSRKPSRRKTEETRLVAEITAAHKRTRGTFGAERLQKDMARHGTVTSIHRVKRLRRQLGIHCVQKKRFKATTNSKHRLPVAPNLLQQKFAVSRPSEVWVSDITYIPTREGWLYLASHKDLFNGEIVGYALADRMTTSLVIQSFQMACRHKRPGPGTIHHSDRGSQYCSAEFRKLLSTYGMIASMSRKGNCYDNAPMESFWGTLKTELVHHRKFETREEAIREIIEYIEIFYNRQRSQARLGFLSPVTFEQLFYQGNQVAA